MTVTDIAETTRIETREHFEKIASFVTILVAEILEPADSYDDSPVRNTPIHEDAVLSVIRRRNGKVVKTIVGSVMAEFSEPGSAVLAAVEIVRLFQDLNLTLAQKQYTDVRIGIHVYTSSRPGIVEFGDVINVAMRILKSAAPMQILISRTVYSTILSESNLHCQWHKNIAVDSQTKEEAFEVNWVETPSNIPSRYEVLSQVGTGGMGIVYKVRDTETSEIIALKILKPGIASDAVMQENLKREVCLARKVTHKNVCRIHEYNRSSGTACISMEFIEGESLQSRMRHVGSLPLEEALTITQQICAGLREAHVQGIVHRDLKPANIMLDRSGSVKIMDFGIARSFQDNSQLTGTITGTPAYMAPEQLELKPVGAYTDIYALGLLIYEMVTGVTAFVGETPVAIALKQIREFPTRPRQVLPTLPANLEAVILKCLQKDPVRRFQSVDELELALKKSGKVTGAAAKWDVFIRELRQVSLEIGRAVNSFLHDLEVRAKREFSTIKALLRQQDWPAIKNLGPKPVLSIGAALVVGSLFVIVSQVSRNRPGHTPFSTTNSGTGSQGSLPRGNERFSHQSNSTNSLAEDTSTAQIPRRDQNGNSDDDSERKSSLDAEAMKRVPESDVGTPAPTKDSKMQSAGQRFIPQSGAIATQLKKSPLAKPNLDSQHPTVVPSSSTVASVEIPPEPKIVEREPELPASKTTATGAAPSTPGTETHQSSDAKSDLSSYYLDAGSFKDPKQADNAVEKLTELGFHAVAIHKSLLWNQSYHVQVGPYTSPLDIQMAQQKLATEGYKTHVVK